MDAFFLTAIATAITAFIVLASDVRFEDKRDEVKLLNYKLSRNTFSLVIIAVMFVFATLIVVIVTYSIHPRSGAVYGVGDFIHSHKFVNLALGFLFGFLFAAWFRQLLVLSPDKLTGWAPRVEALMLVVILLIGGFSQELLSALGRLTQISAAGVSIAFAPQNQTANLGVTVTTIEDVEPVLEHNASGKVEYHSLGKRDGLTFLARMSNAIDRDIEYILLENMCRKKPVNDAVNECIFKDTKEFYDNYMFDDKLLEGIWNPESFKRSIDLLRTTVEPFANCLNFVAKTRGDDADANAMLRPLLSIFRQIVLSKELLENYSENQLNMRINELSHEYTLATSQFSKDLARTYLLQKNSFDRLKWHCKTFISNRFSMVREKEPEVWNNLKTVASRVELQVDVEQNQKPEAQKGYEEELSKKLGDFIRDASVSTRPYIHLVYANMLWRLGFHEAAWHHMLDFIETSYGKPGARSPADIVMELQARKWLIILVEDWLASKPNLPHSLLEAHLQNIDQTLNILESMQLVKESWKRGFQDTSVDFSQQKFSTRRPCDIADRQKYLALLYMILNRLYISDSARHYAFFDLYSARAHTKLDKIEQVNFSCYSDYVRSAQNRDNQDACTEKDPAYKIETAFSENLLAYSRFQLASARRLAGVDQDAAKERLKNARNIAKVGIDTIKRHARDDESCVLRSPMLAASPSSRAVQLLGDLLDTEERAKSVLQ